jgi:beta-lactamase regulating signal transducer with metallopeptidase domain
MSITLVEMLIRVVLLFLIAWVAVRALGRRSASLRALVWTVALGSALALPALTRALPSFELALLDPPAKAPTSPPTFVPPDAEPRMTAVAPGNLAVAPPVQGIVGGLEAPPLVADERSFSWSAVVLGFWAVGLLLVLCRILASHVLLHRLSRRAREFSDAAWRGMIAEVSRELGIRRHVRVRLSDAVQVPAVAGVFRPVLLLPIESEEWSAIERRDVALHELAHVARWDALAQLVGQVSCAVYWFVPLAWLGARQAAALRERACDDIVLNAGIRASSYARNLLNLARVASGAELEPAALAMARPSRIEERVMGILDHTARRDRVTGRAALTVLMLAGTVIGGVAAIEPVRKAAVLTPEEEVRFSESGQAGGTEYTSASIAIKPDGQGTSVKTLPDTNLFCSRGVTSNQNSVHQDGEERTWTVKVEGRDCKVEMRVEGKVEFNDAFTDIASISRDGFFKLSVTDRGTRRELEIRPSGGSLTRVYKLNGAEHAFDEEARAWFGGFLIALDRTTAVAVDTRLPRLLQQGGVSAVLTETAQMPSDYARNVYYTRLLEERKLSSAELVRLLDQAASLTESDYYASELLKSVGRDGLSEPGARAAVLKMVRNMESDYYRSEVMRSFMASAKPGNTEMNVMLEVVGLMESDYYQAEVLKQAMESGDLDAGQRALVARAASTMESGYYAGEVLKSLVARGNLTEAERAAFFEALDHMDDDYQKSEILGVLMRSGDPTQGQIEMILRATQEMDSDYYRSEVLGQLLNGSTLREADLLSLVTSIKDIGSDYYKDEILRKVLRNDGASARVKQAVVEAAEGMSDYHRDEVRRAARSM